MLSHLNNYKVDAPHFTKIKLHSFFRRNALEPIKYVIGSYYCYTSFLNYKDNQYPLKNGKDLSKCFGEKFNSYQVNVEDFEIPWESRPTWSILTFRGQYAFLTWIRNFRNWRSIVTKFSSSRVPNWKVNLKQPSTTWVVLSPNENGFEISFDNLYLPLTQWKEWQNGIPL